MSSTVQARAQKGGSYHEPVVPLKPVAPSFLFWQEKLSCFNNVVNLTLPRALKSNVTSIVEITTLAEDLVTTFTYFFEVVVMAASTVASIASIETAMKDNVAFSATPCANVDRGAHYAERATAVGSHNMFLWFLPRLCPVLWSTTVPLTHFNMPVILFWFLQGDPTIGQLQPAFSPGITSYSVTLLLTYDIYDMAVTQTDYFANIQYTATLVPSDDTPPEAALCCTSNVRARTHDELA
eukprot:9478409-Pyramimonas_sp.AAC.5